MGSECLEVIYPAQLQGSECAHAFLGQSRQKRKESFGTGSFLFFSQLYSLNKGHRKYPLNKANARDKSSPLRRPEVLVVMFPESLKCFLLTVRQHGLLV